MDFQSGIWNQESGIFFQPLLLLTVVRRVDPSHYGCE